MSEQSTDPHRITIDVTRMPRIPFRSYADADERTRALWDSFRRPPGDPGPNVEHPMFRTLIHNPELMQVSSPYVQYLKHSTCLPVRHREIVILRTAWNCGADDQWYNHVLIGLDSGLTQDEIDRIPVGADATGWSPEESAVLRAVDELHVSCRVGDETWNDLARQYDEGQLIEFLVLVGNYRTLSYIQNSIGIRPATGTSPDIPGNRFLFTAS